jgi:hypothetical protein
MPTPIPASSYPLLMDLINQTYLDRVERIDGAQVDDNDNIIAAAVDGRKLLAVRVSDDGIDVKLRQAKASATQFAAPKGQKSCKTGISCGATCISASKTCSKKTTPKQKAQKQKIVADAKGGALVAPAGRLAATDKKTDKGMGDEKGAKKKSVREKPLTEQIDEKYASENPSDSDVAGWTKERVAERFEPSVANVSRRAVIQAQRNLTITESAAGGYVIGKFSNRVKDKDSYAKASVAYEEWERKKYPQHLANRRDPEIWYESIKSEGRLSEVELTKTQAAVAKGVASAAKRLAEHNAAVVAEPAERARAQEIAARYQAQHSQSKAERIRHHKEEFDRIAATEKQKMEQVWQPVQAGKKSAFNNAKQEALGGVIPRRESSKRGTFEPISDDDIKQHLQDLAKRPNPDMFSGSTKADVRKQYRDLAAKYHPDNKATGNEKEFRRVTDAYNQKLEEFN